MLTLTRKRREAVLLRMPDGTTVRVVVVEVRDGKVRLGFDAPGVEILREELLERTPPETKPGGSDGL